MNTDNRQKTLAFMADPLAADTGFLHRFLMCEPPSAIGTRFAANARCDELALAGFAAHGRDHDVVVATMREEDVQCRCVRLQQ